MGIGYDVRNNEIFHTLNGKLTDVFFTDARPNCTHSTPHRKLFRALTSSVVLCVVLYSARLAVTVDDGANVTLRTAGPFLFDPTASFSLQSSLIGPSATPSVAPISYGLACSNTKKRLYEPIVVGTTQEYGTFHAIRIASCCCSYCSLS